jgi:hypothetical protein
MFYYYFFDPSALELGVMTEGDLQKRLKIERKLERVTGDRSRLEYWRTDLHDADWVFWMTVMAFDEGLGHEAARIVDRFDPKEPKPERYPAYAGEALDVEMEHFLHLISSGGSKGKARTRTHRLTVTP